MTTRNPHGLPPIVATVLILLTVLALRGPLATVRAEIAADPSPRIGSEPRRPRVGTTLADDFGLRTVGAVGGTVDAVAVGGDFVYAAAGVRLVVLTADAEARVLGMTAPLSRPVQRLAVVDDYVYAATGGCFILVFDVSRPEVPVMVSTMQLPGTGDFVELATNGSDLFASSRWCDPALRACNPDSPYDEGWMRRIWAIDASTPEQPAVAHEIEGVFAVLAATDRHLYAWDHGDNAARNLGLRAYSYDRLAGFSEVWSRENSESVLDVALAAHGENLFVLNDRGIGDSSLEILDLADPNAPTTVDETRYFWRPHGLFVDDRRLHVLVGGELVVRERAGNGWSEPVYQQRVSEGRSLAAAGPIVFASGSSLHVVDTRRHLADVVQIGSVVQGERPRDVAIVGDIAYVSHGNGLSVYDIAGELVETDRLVPTYGRVTGVAAEASLMAAMATENIDGVNVASLVLYGVGERGQIAETGRLELDGWLEDGFVLDDGYLYGCDRRADAFVVYDVRDPGQPMFVSATPFLTGPFDARSYGADVYVSGTRAYVAVTGGPSSSEGGLAVIDISDRANPKPLGYFTGYDIEAVHVWGDHAFVAGDPGLVVFDVSEPTEPTEVLQVEDLSEAGDLCGVGTRLVVAAGSDIAVVDITTPTAPQIVASTPWRNRDGSTGIVAAGPTWAAQIVNYDRLTIFDASGTGEKGVSLRLRSYGGANDIALANNVAVSTVAGGGLRMHDVRIREAPRTVGQLSHGWSGAELVVDGDLAFVNGGDRGGLKILDLTDVSSPRVLGTYRPADPGEWLVSRVHGIATGHDVAYVLVDILNRSGWYASKLDVVDVADPKYPTRIASISLQHMSEKFSGRYAIAHDGQLALIAYDSIVIVDVTDPSRPLIVGVHRVGYGIVSAEAAGQHVALLTEEGLVIADPWDPSKLEAVGTLPIEAQNQYGFTRHMAFEGGAEHALLSVVSGPRLMVVDLSDPSRPTVIGRYGQPSGNAHYGNPSGWRLLSSAIDGYHVHLTAEGGGYMVMEIASLRPTWTSTIVLPFAASPG